MTRCHEPVLLILATLFFNGCGQAQSSPQTALSTAQLESAPGTRPEPAKMVDARDGTKLATRRYQAAAPRAVLIFYHGGGAHSGASYQHLARDISERHGVTVWTPDLRGHGLSGGRRGDAPSSKIVLNDIATVIKAARNEFPALPLFVGGHSSGAGLLLNFWSDEAATSSAGPIAGYLMLAPQLGFRSKTERDDIEVPFANVKVGQFVLNSMTFGLACGHCYAVRFRYPEALLKRDPLLVDRNSVNLANALTPTSPKRQLKRLNAPLGIWLAADDVLIDAGKVERFIKESSPKAEVETVPDEEHLSILLAGGILMGNWLKKQLDDVTPRPGSAPRSRNSSGFP